MGSLGRLLSTVCGERCFTVLGRTGPATSRARRAACHPAGNFTTLLLPPSVYRDAVTVV